MAEEYKPVNKAWVEEQFKNFWEAIQQRMNIITLDSSGNPIITINNTKYKIKVEPIS
jgi:hypothetical protein